MGEMYLIWSNEHQAWWRPNSCGYTIHVEAAGRYEREKAINIASGSRDGWFCGEAPPEIAIRECDVLAHRRHRAKRCPTCNSPDPKRHPAMQFEGEVQTCRDPWHTPAVEPRPAKLTPQSEQRGSQS